MSYFIKEGPVSTGGSRLTASIDASLGDGQVSLMFGKPYPALPESFPSFIWITGETGSDGSFAVSASVDVLSTSIAVALLPSQPDEVSTGVALPSLKWGGITSVRDSSGNLLTNWNVSSDSGFNYRFAAPVPEPAEYAMLIAGLAVIACMRKPRDRSSRPTTVRS
jgi:hypothetical protein